MQIKGFCFPKEIKSSFRVFTVQLKSNPQNKKINVLFILV